MKGIYIVANDKVLDNAIALLNSVRLYDPEIPIYMIPFDDHYQNAIDTLGQLHNVQLFPDLELVERITQNVGEIFDRDFLALPNKMRKLAVWFGVLDDFLYIDTDIVVFEKISDRLDRLAEVDFFCADYHYFSEGLRNVFSHTIIEKNIFNDNDLQDVFNSGFWGSRKGVITEEQLYEVLKECSKHREYFDFSHGVTDQPILNFLVLKCFPKRENLVKASDKIPGSWAGSKHFKDRDFVLYDKDERLQYLHWAGIALNPEAPYWTIWEHYRYLHDPNSPERIVSEPEQKLWKKVSRLIPFGADR